MPQLQKPLQGLARFLGLQSQGSLAVNWTPNMVPTFDMTDWIGPPISDQARDPTVAINGTFTAFTVPDGQLWRIYAVGVMVIPPAGVFENSYLRLLRSGASQGQYLGPTGFPTTRDAAGNVFMHQDAAESGFSLYPNNLWLSSGDSLGVRIREQSGAGNSEIRMFLQYQNTSV